MQTWPRTSFAAIEWILNDRAESVTAMLSKQAINLPEKAEDNALSMVKFRRRAHSGYNGQLYSDNASF